MYQPAELPEVDCVEVFGLRGSDPPRVSQYMRHIDRCAWMRLDGSDALAVAELWRKLPPGQTMRCHVPPFGLRFRRSGNIVVEASLCWECNNAFGFSGDDQVDFDFDGQSEAAQALLTVLRRTMRDGLGYE